MWTIAQNKAPAKTDSNPTFRHHAWKNDGMASLADRPLKPGSFG
jgi:hypothetical protein